MGKPKALVTGGAGFIGCNTAARLLTSGWDVTVLDDLSRPGAARNLDWLRALGRFEFLQEDVRDADAVHRGISAGAPWDAILHLAAQVAVTASLERPREDFDANALGTLNVLEAARSCKGRPAILVASSNKVYGDLARLRYRETPTRYECEDLPRGVDETFPVEPGSPYACSKAAADLYAATYAKIYGLRTVVFRQSCVYGPRQFGAEDQGWLAHFALRHAEGAAVTLCGNGKQVRDVLHVDDLVEAYVRLLEAPAHAQNGVYNVGGGAEHTLSLIEALDALRRLTGSTPRASVALPRPGDQKVFVSDIGRAERELGWRPSIGVERGLRSLVDWVGSVAAARRAETLRRA